MEKTNTGNYKNEKPPLNDLQFWHRWVSLFGIPAILATLGWFWISFDQVRIDVSVMKNDVAQLKGIVYSNMRFAPSRFDRLTGSSDLKVQR